MKKNLKRIIFIFTLSLCIFSLTCFITKTNINASENYLETVSENGKGSWTPSEITSQNLYGMTYTHMLGNTKAATYNNDQQINVFSMKTDGVYSKLVNWAYQDRTYGYRKATLDVVAKNYEETHPGWIVLGGINADQYAVRAQYINKVPMFPAPFYPLIMDGERRFGYGLTGNSNNYVGVTNDPNNPFIYESNIKGYYLYTVDENNKVTGEYKVDKFNAEPGANETAVWMAVEKVTKTDAVSHTTYEVIGDNVFYVSNAELAYVSNGPEYETMSTYAGFGRGTIDATPNTCVVDKGQFAIETTNQQVANALNVGQKIIVQIAYENENMNNVELSIGFHSAQRKNDVDVEGQGSYDTQVYSRSIFGRKSDGTYVLVTVDKRDGKFHGMTQDESNALLKSLGVVEAYQQDGGGSVCATLRNSFGTFDIVNTPKDGSTRANFNGLLFVVRDPGYKVNTAKNTRTTIEIVREENENSKLVKNMVITVDGKQHSMTGDKLTIDGLKEDTEYNVTYTFDMYNEKNGEYESVSYSVPTKTKPFVIPDSGIVFTEINKTSVKAVKRETEQSSWIQDVVIEIDGNEYQMGSANELLIEGLVSENRYDANIKYTVVEPSTGNVYHNTEERSFTTLAYQLPTVKIKIASLRATSMIVQVIYTDDDDVVTDAELVCNDKTYKLSSKTSSQIISDLDFENNIYTLKVVLTYKAGKFRDVIESEEIKVGKGTVTEIKHSINYELDGGKLEGAPTEYVEGKGLTSLPTPTKEGYEFEGWYYNGNKVTEISKNLTEDVVLTAKWKEVKKKGGCNLTAVSSYLVTFIVTLSGLVIVLRKRK